MKKELIYILKRVIIGVLIGVILFSLKSCNVKALTNPTIGTEISEQGQFISLNSNNQYTLRGYSLIKNSDFYYALPSGQPFTYGQYGGSITQCDIPVVNNNFYSLTYYFITADVYSFHPDYSSYPYKVGIGSNWLNTIPNFNLTSQSGANQTACISGFYSPFGDCITSYTAIFKANSNNTCVTLAFSSNTRNVTSSEMAFVGYTYESLGSQPLTQEQMTNIINNANQQVINNITSSSQNIINNNNNNRDAIINNQNQNTQEIISEQQNTTDAVEDLNDTMQDSSTDSPNDGINAVKNGLASNGVITQLITLPVTLFQQILSSINGTCQTFNLGSLYGTDLILPCINVSNYLGTTLWGIIDVIISGFFVWVIARKMISAFEMFSAMKDGDVLDD